MVFFFAFFFKLTRITIDTLVNLHRCGLSTYLDGDRVFTIAAFLLLILKKCFSCFGKGRLGDFFLLVNSI